MSRRASERLEFPGFAPGPERPPAAVRWAVTIAVVAVAAAAGAFLQHRAALLLAGSRGAALYNSGEPGLAYPHLQRAVRGTSLHARPCVDLGDMAVWAIDDGVFQHFYKIDDSRLLARLAFLAYSEALKRQPGSAKAWAGMAELFKKARILRIKEGIVSLDALGEEAATHFDVEDRLVIEAYRKAVRFESNNYFYHAYLGDFYDERGFRREALASYGRAMEIMPDLSWHYYLPKQDVPPDLYAAAADALERAVRTNPGFSRARLFQNMADLAQRGDDVEAAIENFKRAAASAPDPASYLYLLGDLYFTQRRYEEAERTLQDALTKGRLTPGSAAIARTLLARCAMLRDDFQGAVEHLRQARWLNPMAAYIAQDLGRAYEKLGMADKAEAEFQSAIRLEPNRAGTYTALIDMYRRTRQLNKAIPLAQRLVEMFPDNPVFRDQLRALHRELGRPGEG